MNTAFEVTLKEDGKFKLSPINDTSQETTPGAGDDQKDDPPAQNENTFNPSAGTVMITNDSGRGDIEVKSYNIDDSWQVISADKKTINDGEMNIIRNTPCKESDSSFRVHIKLGGTKVTSGKGLEVMARKCYTYGGDNCLRLD